MRCIAGSCILLVHSHDTLDADMSQPDGPQKVMQGNNLRSCVWEMQRHLRNAAFVYGHAHSLPPEQPWGLCRIAYGRDTYFLERLSLHKHHPIRSQSCENKITEDEVPDV